MKTDQLDNELELARLANAEAKQKMLETRIAADQAELAFFKAETAFNAAFERWHDSVQAD